MTLPQRKFRVEWIFKQIMPVVRDIISIVELELLIDSINKFMIFAQKLIYFGWYFSSTFRYRFTFVRDIDAATYYVPDRSSLDRESPLKLHIIRRLFRGLNIGFRPVYIIEP